MSNIDEKIIRQPNNYFLVLEAIWDPGSSSWAVERERLVILGVFVSYTEFEEDSQRYFDSVRERVVYKTRLSETI